MDSYDILIQHLNVIEDPFVNMIMAAIPFTDVWAFEQFQIARRHFTGEPQAIGGPEEWVPISVHFPGDGVDL